MRVTLRQDERAATALEFAIVAPILILTIFCFIQFGLIVWAQTAMQHGAAMAARCGAVNATVCDTTAAIQRYARDQSLGLYPDPSTFTVSHQTCGLMVQASLLYSGGMTGASMPAIQLNAKACFGRDSGA